MSSLFGTPLWGGAGLTSGPPLSGIPVGPLLYMAFRLANVHIYPNAAETTAGADQMHDAILLANLMISQANIESLMISSRFINSYVLGTSKTYTMGPGGTLLDGSGNPADRPTRIEFANLALTTGPVIRLHIHIGDDDSWRSLSLQDLPGAFPRLIYCDYAFTVATVYLFPQDRGGDSLELYTWEQVASIQSSSDLVAFRPGYDTWFTYNLAIKLADAFKSQGGQVSEATIQTAWKADKALRNYNAQSARLASDFPGSGRRHDGGTFNYLNGQPGS